MGATGDYKSIAAGYSSTGPGLYSTTGVAIDSAGSAWVSNAVAISNATSGSISGVTGSLTSITPQLGYVSSQLAAPQGIVVDGSGNVWVRNSAKATVTTFVGVGAPVVTPLALGVKNGTLGARP